MLPEHEHEWVFYDTYFNHNSDEIYDVYECECGAEKKNGA
jgi:hypothetical protein